MSVESPLSVASPPLSVANSKYIWKFTSEIVDTIISAGGIIFGGAVRDMYRHDMYANLYYDMLRNNTHVNHANANAYTDTSFLPDTIGRLEIPNSIDACISQSHLNKLMNDLKVNNISVDIKFKDDLEQYLHNNTLGPCHVKHFCITLTPYAEDAFSNMKTNFADSIRNMPELQELFAKLQEKVTSVVCTVKLDLMVIYNVHYTTSISDAPFGNLDFTCNGVIMDIHGLRLSSYIEAHVTNPIQRQILLNKVLDDILHKNTYMCENATLEQTKKMFAKGWNIYSHNFQLLAKPITSTNICVICHNACTSHYCKLKCCDAIYHDTCLVESWKHQTHGMRKRNMCPVCNTRIRTDDTNNVFMQMVQHLVQQIPMYTQPCLTSPPGLVNPHTILIPPCVISPPGLTNAYTYDIMHNTHINIIRHDDDANDANDAQDEHDANDAQDEHDANDTNDSSDYGNDSNDSDYETYGNYEN